MVQHASARVDPAAPGSADAGYRPGVCNIGPEEIARRRRAGHVGALASVVVLAVLVVDAPPLSRLLVALPAAVAPPLSRLLVALPAAVAASGYLQARLRFCAGFGSTGVYNFGPLGSTQKVAGPEARRRDRAMALRIGLASSSSEPWWA